MAKISMIEREKRRAKTVKRFEQKRKSLKSKMMDMNLSNEERADARAKFHALPRDASPSRMHNRCQFTGRPHGFYRKFGLCRNKLREMAMNGEIPGLRKASW